MMYALECWNEMSEKGTAEEKFAEMFAKNARRMLQKTEDQLLKMPTV